MMKCFLALILIATIGLFTIGCEPKKDTMENKTQTTVTQTKDGTVTGQATTTTVDKTTTTAPVAPAAYGKTPAKTPAKTTEKTTETTTETTK